MVANVVSSHFGYYPETLTFDRDLFSIRTLPDHSAATDSIDSDPNRVGKWLYAGQRQIQFGTGRIYEMPYSARIFGLPKTHQLILRRHREAGDLDFIIWCLSFFSGMRLTSADAGFLDATPSKPGVLVDFSLSRCTLADTVDLGLSYLDTQRQDSRAAKRISAVIHTLFLAQSPRNLPFEAFQYLYMALDACYRLLESRESCAPRIAHRKRIKWMCEKFGLTVPEWACPAGEDSTSISTIRNDAFHEGLFFGEPLGFSIYGGTESQARSPNVLLQIQAVVCRLLVAILGRSSSAYVTSAIDTRSIHPLNLVD